MKPRNLTVISLLLASLLVGPVYNITALTWTGLSTVTNLWSDTNNWSPAEPLTFDDQAIFGNAGATNVIGAVNNVADADYVLTNLVYSALWSNSVFATNFDTTLLNTGVTLTVRSPNGTFMYVGTGVDNGANATNYTTILGSGRLILGDPASPTTYSNGFLQVKQSSVTSGNHRAILDMSRLDSFVFAAGKFLVAANGTFGGGGDRVQGNVVLAKTNVITCSAPSVTDPSDYLTEQPFTIGQSQGSQSAATFTNVVLLGQENTINADYMRVAGLKMNGQISFRSGLTNPTLKLRAADGVNRLPRIVLGDATEARVVSFNCRGNLDLRGGTVDALVQDMYVGKNGWRGPADGGSGDNTGGALGVMSLAGGTFDVTTLNVGCQQGDNAGTATGTVNVLTNATLVAGNLNIGSEAGTVGNGTGVGRLFINGGRVTVSGNLIENDAPGANGSSLVVITNDGSLNLMPAGDTVPGDITVDTLTVGSASVTNYGTLALSTLNVLDPATSFTVYAGQALAPVGKGLVGPLNVNGSLTLESGTLRFDLNAPGNNDVVNVTGTLALNGVTTADVSAVGGTITPGTYTVLTYGALSGGTNNLQVSGALANSRYSFVFDAASVPSVNLIVGGGPSSSLTWSGDGLANVWDLHTTTNWNSHTERFYDLDTVTFDDTGSASPAVSLAGTLEPAGVVTVNATKNYTFSGSGKISGSAGLSKSGTGTLTISAFNDYTGDTTVDAGVLLVNGVLGNTAVHVVGGTLGGNGSILGPVTVQSGAVFAPGSPLGTLTISNNLVLSDGSSSVFEANMDTLTYDRVVGLTRVAFGGTLSLALSGRPVAATDSFKLFSATTAATAFSTPYGGAFANILPVTPGPAGLAWNTNSLGIDGTLRVVSTVPASMTVQRSGDQFTVSWPPDHVGWRLQRQTNPAGVGLTSDWVDVAGTANTSSLTVTINSTNGSVFYRMVFP
jgi:autotransporter-associated beta strand protein